MDKFTGVVLTDQNLIVFFNGKQHTFQKGDPYFEEALKCVRNNDTKGFEKIFRVNPDKVLRNLSDGKLRWENNEISIGTPNGDKKFPEELYRAVVETTEAGLSYDRLVKFAYKLFQHPDPGSVEQFYTYLAKHNFPLCDDGDFIAYKGVNQDFKDCRSGTFDNSPGKTVSMPRENVCHDRNVTCAEGLHVAAWNYVATSYSGSRKVAVKVDPRNVVSVPKDHNEEKIRTCGYYVIGEIDAAIEAVASDLDKEVHLDSEKEELKELLNLNGLNNTLNKNIIYWSSTRDEETSEEVSTLFLVDHKDGNRIDDHKRLDHSVLYFLSKETFLSGLKLLKNKKSGYWEPLLELKRAYKAGLVKMVDLDQECKEALLKLS